MVRVGRETGFVERAGRGLGQRGAEGGADGGFVGLKVGGVLAVTDASAGDFDAVQIRGEKLRGCGYATAESGSLGTACRSNSMAESRIWMPSRTESVGNITVPVGAGMLPARVFDPFHRAEDEAKGQQRQAGQQVDGDHGEIVDEIFQPHAAQEGGE